MLKELFEWISDQGSNMYETDDERLFFKYTRSDGMTGFEERTDMMVKPTTRDRNGDHLVLSSVASLVDMCLHLHAEGYPAPRITISPADREIEAVWENGEPIPVREVEARIEAVVVRLGFKHTIDNQSFTFPDFLDWLDLKGQYISFDEDREKIVAAVKRLKFTDLSSVEWQDHGAYITVKQTAMKGVEPESTPIPTRLTMYFPTGTSEFDVKHEFSLRVNPKEQKIVLTLLNREDVIGKFMDDCRTRLKNSLKDLKPLILDGR